MLSGLPNIADKNFIVGFFLPVVVALFIAAWTFPDIAILAPLRSAEDKTLGDLAWLVLAVWTLSVVLLTTNHLQYRFLEGYLPPISWFGCMRTWHHWRFDRIANRRRSIQQQWKAAGMRAQDIPAGQRHEASRLAVRLLPEFPTTRVAKQPDEILADGIMPTRFGNVIRALEVYPRELYGADSIPVWLRLASVVPKDFATEIEEARAQVNCFMNICYLALVFCGYAIARIVLGTLWSGTVAEDTGMPTAATIQAGLPAAWGYDLTVALAARAVAWVSYRWATALLVAWGDLVKSAFDCYLPALVRQLGYAVPPDAAARRSFWREFNGQVAYWRPMPTAWPQDGAPAHPSEHDGQDNADGVAPP